MIKSFIGLGYVFLAAIVLLPFGILGGLFHLIGLRELGSLIVYRVVQGWSIFLIKILGCTVTVSGREKILKKDGVCFVSNHDGYFDIVMLLAYCGRPFGFIAKKELIFLPFINLWIYMLGGLFIDRKNIKNAVKTINKGVKRIKTGGSMIIFPEGHRAKGRGLLPFHPGSLKLATQAGAPIIPVAIEGTYKVFEEHKRVRGASLKISFLDLIDTASIPSADKKQVLCDKIYSAISDELTGTKQQAVQ